MKDILNSHTIQYLKKEISKTNIKGYSKMKKGELVNLMSSNSSKFGYIKHKSKPVKAAPAKKAPPKAKSPPKADNLKKAVGVSREEANKMDFFALMKNLPSDIKKNIGGQVKGSLSDQDRGRQLRQKLTHKELNKFFQEHGRVWEYDHTEPYTDTKEYYNFTGTKKIRLDRHTVSKHNSSNNHDIYIPRLDYQETEMPKADKILGKHYKKYLEDIKPKAKKPKAKKRSKKKSSSI